MTTPKQERAAEAMVEYVRANPPPRLWPAELDMTFPLRRTVRLVGKPHVAS